MNGHARAAFSTTTSAGRTHQLRRVNLQFGATAPLRARGVCAPHHGNEAVSARVSQRSEQAISTIITKGGDGTSSVPSDVPVEAMIRARTVDAMQEVNAIVDRCLRAGALAAGAEVLIETVCGYLPNTPGSESDPAAVRSLCRRCGRGEHGKGCPPGRLH